MKNSFLAFCFIASIGKAFTQTMVPFSSEQWQFYGEGYILEDYQNKTCVKLDDRGAILKEVPFFNGIIEYDISFPQGRGFIGVSFRAQDEKNRENFYIRPHQSENPDAIQYQPIYNGIGSWQLYHGKGYNAPVAFTFNEWMHVKLVISGTQMEVFISDMEKPALFVDKLKRPVQSSTLSFDGYHEIGFRFANFSYQSIDNPVFITTKKATEVVLEGTIKRWQISESFSENLVTNVLKLNSNLKSQISFEAMDTEETGMLNLASGPLWSKDKNTTFARLIIESERDQIKVLQLGFSDRVGVYLNDQIAYSGNDGIATRDYRFLGTVGYYDQVYLYLKRGEMNFGLLFLKVSTDGALKVQLPTKQV